MCRGRDMNEADLGRDPFTGAFQGSSVDRTSGQVWLKGKLLVQEKTPSKTNIGLTFRSSLRFFSSVLPCFFSDLSPHTFIHTLLLFLSSFLLLLLLPQPLSLRSPCLSVFHVAGKIKMILQHKTYTSCTTASGNPWWVFSVRLPLPLWLVCSRLLAPRGDDNGFLYHVCPCGRLLACDKDDV